MKIRMIALLSAALLTFSSAGLYAANGDTMLFHLKTGLKHDDAQICVAYNAPINKVPKTYGQFLNQLHDKGAKFYINSAFLVVAKIEDQLGTVDYISAKFFQPVSLKEMIRLRTSADYYMVY